MRRTGRGAVSVLTAVMVIVLSREQASALSVNPPQLSSIPSILQLVRAVASCVQTFRGISLQQCVVGAFVPPPTSTPTVTPTSTRTITPTPEPTITSTSTVTPTPTPNPCTNQPDGKTCDAGRDLGNTFICVSSSCQACVPDGNGIAGRFVDNGDGTVTDLHTCLVWEKKRFGTCIFTPAPGFPIACTQDSDCDNNNGGGVCVSCPHCVSATYTWTSSGAPFPPNGTAFSGFLGSLNSSSPSFAGHHDWRLPAAADLATLWDPIQGSCLNGIGPCSVPAIDPVFGVSQSGAYWSASPFSGYSVTPGDLAYIVLFGDPGLGQTWDLKSNAHYVRAVRGGP